MQNLFSLDEFVAQMALLPSPVILLEGTRQLPVEHQHFLSGFAKSLAEQLPTALFRSGNATGSDEAFAAGIVRADASRMEYVLPHTGHRSASRSKEARTVAIDEISEAALQILRDQTQKATPHYATLIEQRHHPARRAKLNYLLRDTLKVIGDSELNLAPASCGFFYVNPASPTKGGTAHTIRVCQLHTVPAWTQNDWLIDDSQCVKTL